MLSSQIVDDQSSFISRSFLIRYCEEEVEINDIGLFRAEIDVEPEYLNTSFFLEVELFFSDLSSLGGPEEPLASLDLLVVRAKDWTAPDLKGGFL